jgi:hypothetical protein
MKIITKSQDRFIYPSFQERYYIATNKIKGASNYKYTQVEGYQKYDYTFTLKGKECIAEAKIRAFKSTQHTTAYLEKDKYDALIQLHKETGAIPIYTMFYTDKVVAYFNLLNFADIEPVQEHCPKTSKGTNQQEYINKYVIHLPLDRAKKLSYTIPKFNNMIADYNKLYKVV